MVEADGGNDANPGVQDIGGVQTAAQPYLDGLHISQLFGETLKGHASQVFE